VPTTDPVAAALADALLPDVAVRARADGAAVVTGLPAQGT
jgi:hypothetical protein